MLTGADEIEGPSLSHHVSVPTNRTRIVMPKLSHTLTHTHTHGLPNSNWKLSRFIHIHSSYVQTVNLYVFHRIACFISTLEKNKKNKQKQNEKNLLLSVGVRCAHNIIMRMCYIYILLLLYNIYTHGRRRRRRPVSAEQTRQENLLRRSSLYKR